MKTQEVKETISNFLTETLVEKFPEFFTKDKVFWERTVEKVPEFPYIMLSQKSISKLNKRYENYKKDTRYLKKTQKKITINFGVYTSTDGLTLFESEKLAQELIDFIEELFTNDALTFNSLCTAGITVEELEVSDIKDLSDFTKTANLFRKEIDIPFKYEHVQEVPTEAGKALIININTDSAKKGIEMEVNSEHL